MAAEVSHKLKVQPHNVTSIQVGCYLSGKFAYLLNVNLTVCVRYGFMVSKNLVLTIHSFMVGK